MPFPSVGTRSTDDFADSSGTITYPATIAVDDLLLFRSSNDGAGDKVSGWGGAAFGNDVLLNFGGDDNGATIAFHKAVGDEDGTTFTLTLTSGEKCVWTIFPIAGWETTLDPEMSTNATGDSTGPNAGSVTASWGGSEDNLFCWSSMHDNTPGVTTYPTDYSASEYFATGSGGSTSMAVAFRELAGDTNDPGAALLGAAEAWQSQVVVVAPTGAGDGDVTLTADPSQLTLAGSVAGLVTTLAAAAGALALTGADANFTTALDAQPGSLVLTGAEADLVSDADVVLDASPGALILTGADAGLIVTLDAQPGALALTGADAGLIVTLDAQPGALALTGAEADLIVEADVALDAAPGALVLAGAEATLTVTALVVRRGGVRFLLEPDPEIREQKVAQLKTLLKPGGKPRTAASEPEPPQKSLMDTLSRVTSGMTTAQQTRTDRLLQETGISMDELIILLS